jgi:hypothetical protein
MRDKGLATLVATLLAAFATAHLMQFGLSAGRAITGEENASPIGIASLVASRGGHTTAKLPPTPAPASDPVAAALHVPEGRITPRDAALPIALGTVRTDGFGRSCARMLSLRPVPGALIEARVEAACDAGMRVEMSHAGLRFAVAVGADGTVSTRIPALMPEATVAAGFADGDVITARIETPEAAEVERVVLVAEGWAGLALHAAGTASWRGHVGLASTGPEPSLGGEIIRLGDPTVEAPLLADVHTSSTGRFGALGGVSLRVEAALSPANCARDVSAEVIRSSGGVRPSPVALRLSLPSCDSEGGILVVDLPLPGLRLARN